MSKRLVHINKKGNLEVDGVEIDLNSFLDKLDTKPSIFLQTVAPKVFKIGDFWYDPKSDIFSIGRFVNSKLYWVELPFGIGGYGSNNNSGNASGGITQSILNSAMSALTLKINTLNVRNVNDRLVDNNNEPILPKNILQYRNVSLLHGEIIEYSSQYNIQRNVNNILNNATDFNVSNDWLSLNGERDDMYCIVDLGKEYNIIRTELYNQNEYSDSHRDVDNFIITASNDLNTWDEILDNNMLASGGVSPNPANVYDIDNKTYRYWKITLKTFHGNDSYGGLMKWDLISSDYSLVDEYLDTNIRKMGNNIQSLLGIKQLPIMQWGVLYSNTPQATEGVTGDIKLLSTGSTPGGITSDIENSNFTINVSGIYIINCEYSHYNPDGSIQTTDNRTHLYVNNIKRQSTMDQEVESTIFSSDLSASDKSLGWKTGSFTATLYEGDTIDVRVGNNFTADIFNSRIIITQVGVI